MITRRLRLLEVQHAHDLLQQALQAGSREDAVEVREQREVPAAGQQVSDGEHVLDALDERLPVLRAGRLGAEARQQSRHVLHLPQVGAQLADEVRVIDVSEVLQVIQARVDQLERR